MSPGSHCYFDHYQADPSTEPKAIGGFTTLKKVYSFDPVPGSLNDDQKEFILGAQGNVWTEYMHDGDHVEYMILPRMSALAEVLWTTRERRDWKDFSARTTSFMNRLDVMGLNYSLGSFQVSMGAEYDNELRQVKVRMETENPEAEIRYTLDGSRPGENSDIYSEPVSIDKTTAINAIVLRKGEPAGKVTGKKVFIHRATGREPDYSIMYSDKYKASGALTLVDGIRGSLNFADGYWQGFEGTDMDLVIDMGEEVEINKLSSGFVNSVGSWIFLPEWVEYSVSDEGTEYTSLGKVINELEPRKQDREIFNYEMSVSATRARYLRVYAKNIGICPDWHNGAGGKAWIFADEIIVN
jgi:hexosaminidase